jgi:type VI secretion system secreted protein Hcp
MKKLNDQWMTTAVTTMLLTILPFIMAPTPLNVDIKGHPGSNVQQGREKTSDVFEFQHYLSVPFDPATGLQTGSRQHTPLVLKKAIDKASPGLHAALVSGEVIETVRVDFYRTEPDGQDVKYYTITLTNARIVEVRTFMPTSFLPENEPYPHMEQVSFVYQAIQWSWLPDGSSASDTWSINQP